MVLIVQKGKEWIYNFYFTKNVVTTRVGLKVTVKDEPFFIEKEDFLKNGYGYDFETFTNGFLAKNRIRIRCHSKTKFY